MVGPSAIPKNINEQMCSAANSVIDTSYLLEELRREFRAADKPIEVEFRKLVDWVRLGDQLTHQIHPYPAKLLPHIAHFFINASSFRINDGAVLDPFCGSGTVALEASLAGRTAYVADANPMALLITKVKTTPFDPDQLLMEAVAILKRAKRYRVAPTVPVVNSHLWYTPDRKRNLEILLRAVQEIEDSSVRDFFLLCFSATTRKLSLADPGISVPVRLKTKQLFDKHTNSKIRSHLRWLKDADHLEEFGRICLGNIERVVQTNAAHPGRRKATQVGVDARHLLQPKETTRMVAESVPLVLTSPPYGSAQKYVRAMSLSLNWLGFAGPGELSILEGQTIGREHLPKSRSSETLPLPDDFEDFLRNVGKINGHRECITRQYLFELQNALLEMTRVTCKGGRVILVIGNNQVCGKPLWTDKFIVDTMTMTGLEMDLHLVDKIKSRGLMTKRSPTASVIARESVIVFRKR